MSRGTVFYCRCGARLVGSERVEHRCDKQFRDESNEENRAVWARVDAAAAHAPQWVLDRIEDRKQREGVCSRCDKPIEDWSPPDEGMTAGYYVAAGWQKYANPGEVYICDACMFADPRYIADYGEQLPPAAPQPPAPHSAGDVR